MAFPPSNGTMSRSVKQAGRGKNKLGKRRLGKRLRMMEIVERELDARVE